MNKEQKVKISLDCFNSLIRIFVIEKLAFPAELAADAGKIRSELIEKQASNDRRLDFVARRDAWKRANK